MELAPTVTAAVAPMERPHAANQHNSASETNEWRAELLAATLCGIFGLAATIIGGSARLPLFVLSYLAGSWFSAQDVWELLQKRVLDVHFLMLLVAVGSASIGGWGEGATLLF